MTLGEKIIELSRKGYSVRFQASETFPDAISITLINMKAMRTTVRDTKEKWVDTIKMNCEYGLPHEEAIVYILSELEVRLKEA